MHTANILDLQLLQNVAYAVNAGCRKAFFVLLNVDKNQWTAFVRSTSTSAMAESNCTSAEEGYFSPLRCGHLAVDGEVMDFMRQISETPSSRNFHACNHSAAVIRKCNDRDVFFGL